jgi:hypothetical protein
VTTAECFNRRMKWREQHGKWPTSVRISPALEARLIEQWSKEPLAHPAELENLYLLGMTWHVDPMVADEELHFAAE